MTSTTDRRADSDTNTARDTRADDEARVHDDSNSGIHSSTLAATGNTFEVWFPPFSGTFPSWADLETAFESYQKDTHQIYKLRTSNSVRDRNRERTKRAAASGKKPVLYNEELLFYSKTFICTHGWEFNPCGNGTRTNHTVRSIECKARLNDLLSQNEDGSYTIRVTKHKSTHNHNVGPDEYYTYAETRKIESPGAKRVVKTLWQGKPIQPKDVESMIAQMRRDTYTSPDADVRVSQVLQDFGEGPGNAVNVFRDPATDLTSCISFQTAHMRRIARKFPEALCIDATHGTNINRYRLFSFMVTDKFGSGSFVQHALIDKETKLNMKSALKAFKENNAAWTDVKVVIIDKDFTEIGVLAEELPDATVILCHFHVIDYLKREMTDIDRRIGFLDTMDYVFTKVHTNRIVCCPTYINVDFPHWCGIIFDMERRIVWKYDPFHKKSFLDEVERIITSVYMEIMNPELKMDIRTFPGWLQRDGYSCGVLMVQWFELYLSVARTTPPNASIPVAHGAKMSPKQLTYERYKHFSYVFDSIVINVDIEQ